ncbi:MAG: hypothetical protein LBE34_16525 [Flavobacteriaceae bacterium]|jgi:DNA-directed RNA polymerase subunit RPC12/RpoP|nr:hypothetical protein [Flavobacteriaceae bacterium]
MTNTTQEIVCPQCGSKDVEELWTDDYLCNSCYSHFFLDSENAAIPNEKDYDSIDHNARNGCIGIGLILFILIIFFVGKLVKGG